MSRTFYVIVEGGLQYEFPDANTYELLANPVRLNVKDFNDEMLGTFNWDNVLGYGWDDQDTEEMAEASEFEASGQKT